MIIAALFVTYLLGSIPFAVITGYIVDSTDIRTKGSGNAGATNVFRVLGWKPALIVLLLDFTKAFAPVFWLPQLPYFSSSFYGHTELLQMALLFCAIIGHAFPIWCQFRGGKGVATAAGGVAAIFWPAVPFCLAVFALTVVLTRFVSLASLLAVWLLPLFYGAFAMSQKNFSWYLLAFFLLIAALITVLHRKNIGRLLKKQEPKI